MAAGAGVGVGVGVAVDAVPTALSFLSLLLFCWAKIGKTTSDSSKHEAKVAFNIYNIVFIDVLEKSFEWSKLELQRNRKQLGDVTIMFVLFLNCLIRKCVWKLYAELYGKLSKVL